MANKRANDGKQHVSDTSPSIEKTNMVGHARMPQELLAAPLVGPSTDEHVFLVGRPPVGEYLGYVKALSVGEVNLKELMDEWRKANDHIQELEAQEKGWADNPPIHVVPQALTSLREKVLEDPIFQRAFSIVPADLAIVDLDRLVVFQKHINLNYVQQLKDRLGPSPREEDVSRFCLPFERQDPQVKVMQTSQNAFTFVSSSDDLRFLEAPLLRATQIQGHSSSGAPAGIVGLMVGYGSNYLNVMHVENRLILNNGSHLAYALRDLGIAQVPCILQKVTRRDELEVIASGDFGQNPDRYLKSPRPPVLKDYFDPQLTKRLKVHRKLRQVTVSFGVSTMDIPAS